MKLKSILLVVVSLVALVWTIVSAFRGDFVRAGIGVIAIVLAVLLLK